MSEKPSRCSLPKILRRAILIPGTGGLRKLRWGGKGKGRRGGYRVVYYFFDDASPVYLLAIYPKNQRIDLAPDQRKRLAALAADLKSSAKARRKGVVLRRIPVR